MNDKVLYLLIGIPLLAILLAAVYFRNKRKRPVDYKALFIMGIAWIPLGIATNNHTFTTVGILFMIVGAKNKKKWEENRFRWSSLSSEEKKIKITVMALILISVAIGAIMYFNQSSFSAVPKIRF